MKKSMNRNFTEETFKVTEQSVQCNIEDYYLGKDCKSKETSLASPTWEPTEPYFIRSKSSCLVKKYISPIQPVKVFLKTRPVPCLRRSAQSVKKFYRNDLRKCQIKKRNQVEGSRIGLGKANADSQSKVYLNVKPKSIMDYYHELIDRPRTQKRTLYNYHKEVGTNDGYKTKLQKDPKITKDSFGNYNYYDTYESDAKRQAKIIMQLTN